MEKQTNPQKLLILESTHKSLHTQNTDGTLNVLMFFFYVYWIHINLDWFLVPHC